MSNSIIDHQRDHEKAKRERPLTLVEMLFSCFKTTKDFEKQSSNLDKHVKNDKIK